MPPWLLRMLEKGPKITQSNKISSDGKLLKHETVENETAHIVPVLSRLCEQDTSVQRAFLCSSKVHHVFKMPREGGFCGYRNIQMLISYIQGSQSPGYENFSKGLPTIIELQDMIEHAWDMGFNSAGKVETGGIRGTRKYIGTPEVSWVIANDAESANIWHTTGSSSILESWDTVSALREMIYGWVWHQTDAKPIVSPRRKTCVLTMLYIWTLRRIYDLHALWKKMIKSSKQNCRLYTFNIKVCIIPLPARRMAWSETKAIRAFFNNNWLWGPGKWQCKSTGLWSDVQNLTSNQTSHRNEC